MTSGTTTNAPAEQSPRKAGQRRQLVVATLLAFSLTIGVLCAIYRVDPLELAHDGTRVVMTPVLALLYADDLRHVESIVQRYRHGDWAQSRNAEEAPNFVYESPDAPHLKALRETFGLDQLAARAPTEYEAMLAIGGWVGGQFDHGTDLVAGGDKACDPVALVKQGRQGAKYWCEIAARLMVHAAASLGWPARIVTASTDGRTWEHAVAELWSNDHAKWFAIDADFNIVYESDGRPLSALDLVRDGQRLRADGALQIRRIAKPKPSIPQTDPLRLYQYIHVDMRTDWCTRSLRRGSPAAGDLATWWTARPGFRSLLTSRQRIDQPGVFDWAVNRVHVDISRPRNAELTRTLVVALHVYSPYFEAFEFRVDHGPWRRASVGRFAIQSVGVRVLEARVVTRGGWRGPVSAVSLATPTAPARTSRSSRVMPERLS